MLGVVYGDAPGVSRDEYNPDSPENAPWWKLKGKAQAERLSETFRVIESRDQNRLQDYLMFYRLYQNQDVDSFSSWDWTEKRSKLRATLNLIRAVTDTAASRIGKQQPRSVFQTYAGNFSMQRKSKLLTRWVDAVKYTSGAEEAIDDMLYDALIFGHGFVMPYVERGGKICVERVFVGELFVDQVAAMNGRPLEMYRRRFVDRSVLLGAFPKAKDEIASLSSGSSQYVMPIDRPDPLADQVELVEAWRLPSYPGAGDGAYAAASDGQLLEYKKYDQDSFPFIGFRWAKDRRGFWGTGLPHELVGLQVDLNRTMGKLQRALTLSAPIMLQEVSSMVKGAKMTNQVGGQYPYRGTPPTFSPGLTVPGEYFAHIQNIWTKAFEQAGMQAMFAGDAPPPGVDAAIAIQELADQGSIRFSMVFRAWRRFHTELTSALVDLGKSMGGEVVLAHDKWSIDRLNWDDIDLEKSAYVLRAMESSNLPQSPALRKNYIMDLYREGLYDDVKTRRLLDIEDTDQEGSLDRAQFDTVDKHVEMMLDEGIAVAPTPFQDHQLALKRTNQWYLWVGTLSEGPPAEHLRLLRNYMTALSQFITRAAAAQQQVALSSQPGMPLPPGSEGQAPQALTPADGPSPMGMM